MNDQIKLNFRSRASSHKKVDQLVRRFSPYDFSDEQVLRQSTGREALLKRISRVIEENLERKEPPNQHLMVLGNRGMGKSFLVRQIQIEVQRLTKQGIPLIFVRLPEEQLNVSAPELLLDEIRRILTQTTADSVRVKWRSGDELEWNKSVEALRSAIANQPEFTDNSGLIVISIENFDVLLEEIFDNEAVQSRLREFLASEPRIMLLATSTTEVDNEHNKRLFQAFKREQLSAWEPDDFVDFYRKTFKGEITDNIEAKLRALAHFTGGSPRLAVLIKDILHTNDAFSAVQTLDQLADELTPYFQDRIMSRLKPKSRWLLDDLLRSGEPCSQIELAKRVGADTQSEIAQPFTTLLREGVVIDRKHSGKKGYYQVADRIFAHFYRKRYLADESHSPLTNLVEFLESFYNQKERAEQLVILVQARRLDEAQVFAETFRHGQNVWGDVKEGGRIRTARQLIEFVQECPDLAAESSFLKEISEVADKINLRDVTQLMHKIQLIAKHTRTPKEEIAVLIVQAAIFLILPNDESAIDHLTAAVEKSRDNEHGSFLQLSIYALGLVEAISGKGLDAKKHLSESMEMEGSLEWSQLYLSTIADQMWNLVAMKEYGNAIRFFDQAISDPIIREDSLTMSRLYYRLGYMKFRQEDNEAGLKATKRAVELCQLADDDYLLSLTTKNLSWFFHHFKRYEEALQAAKLARKAGERLKDDFLVLEAIHAELIELTALSKYQAVTESVPTMISLAREIANPEIESKAQWILADAYQAQNQADKELSARLEAVEAALNTGDIRLIVYLQNLYLDRHQLTGKNCDEKIIDLIMVWSEHLATIKDTRKSKYNFQRSKLSFDSLSKAATLSNRWSEVIDWLSYTPDLLDNFQEPSTTVGDAVVELYEVDGVGSAFSAMAGFLETLREPLDRISTGKKLKNFLKQLLSTTCSQLISKLSHAGLLQDIANELRAQLKADDIAEMLEAAALYHKHDKKLGSLDSVDPDISRAVQVILGIGESGKILKVPKKKKIVPVGYERADHLVNDQEYTDIENQLKKNKVNWEVSPLYTTHWDTPDNTRCVELVVAALGAARQTSKDNAKTLFSQLSSVTNEFGIVTARALSNARGVREITPTFYPDWSLVEISLDIVQSNNAIFCFLLKDQSIIPISGISPPIHELNSQKNLSLTNTVSVIDYLRFFCNSVWGDEGAFRIIDNINQIPLSKAFTENEISEVNQLIHSIDITKHDENSWTTKAVVNYESALFLADFKIHSSGMIEMLDDEPIKSLKNVKREQMESGLRYFKGVFESK